MPRKPARKSAKKVSTPRPITDLIPDGVQRIRSLMVTRVSAGAKAKILLEISGKRYWLEAIVDGPITIGG